ncbi:MAG: DUF2167 domain-containing protein [Acidobacteria bacterium]|nr:DUF2167 domain-containing protein [Acidobacteriota bacterium]
MSARYFAVIIGTLSIVFSILQPGVVRAALPTANGATLKWVNGPTKAAIGSNLAEVEIPRGYAWLGPEDAKKLLASWQNPTVGNELGLIAPDSETVGWVLLFTFDDIGYVEDTERNSLDADALLTELREGTDAGNEVRRKKGWETLELVGWQQKPFYDPATNNLTWATRLRSVKEGDTINHSIRLLGRRGVMSAELLVSPEDYSASIPSVTSLLGDFRFKEGSRYADFVPSTDKVAEYGLAALITGGAVAVAAKSGLLGKLWKLIVPAVIAAGVALKKFFGGKSSE